MRIVFLFHLGKKICRVLQLRVIFTQYKDRSYVRDEYHTHSSFIKTEMGEKVDIVRFLKYLFLVVIFIAVFPL